MSSEDLADFLRKKIGKVKKSNTKIAKEAGISRRTWYRLLSSDIEEARLSTLIKLANALDTNVMELLRVYYKGKGFNKVESDYLDGVVGSNLPDNSIVNVGEVFTKKWELNKLQGFDWSELSLHCIDDDLDVRMISAEECSVQKPRGLLPERKVVSVSSGDNEKGVFSVTFKAPEKPCTTISHWRFKCRGKFLQAKAGPNLYCLVKVVAVA